MAGRTGEVSAGQRREVRRHAWYHFASIDVGDGQWGGSWDFSHTGEHLDANPGIEEETRLLQLVEQRQYREHPAGPPGFDEDAERARETNAKRLGLFAGFGSRPKV